MDGRPGTLGKELAHPSNEHIGPGSEEKVLERDIGMKSNYLLKFHYLVTCPFTPVLSFQNHHCTSVGSHPGANKPSSQPIISACFIGTTTNVPPCHAKKS
jgi:hypothetical protein